jgi:transcriptional regulator GlxA family with amidase domain
LFVHEKNNRTRPAAGEAVCSKWVRLGHEGREMKADPKGVRVCLVAIPEVMASTLMGLYDVLNSFNLLSAYGDTSAGRAHFKAEIVATTAGSLPSASGVPVEAQRSIQQIDSADVIIVPSILVEQGEWQRGRYPALVKWLGEMHAAGAQLCSACSGVLLLAETGLLDGKDATVHWTYAPTFRRNFPNVKLRLDRALVAAGKHQEFLMSGASTSWHDLILYLIAQHAGPTAAQAIVKFLKV